METRSKSKKQTQGHDASDAMATKANINPSSTSPPHSGTQANISPLPGQVHGGQHYTGGPHAHTGHIGGPPHHDQFSSSSSSGMMTDTSPNIGGDIVPSQKSDIVAHGLSGKGDDTVLKMKLSGDRSQVMSAIQSQIDITIEEERRLAALSAQHVNKLKDEAKKAGLWSKLREDLAHHHRQTMGGSYSSYQSISSHRSGSGPTSCKIECDVHATPNLHSLLEGDSSGVIGEEESSEEAHHTAPHNEAQLEEIRRLTQVALDSVAAVAKHQLRKQTLDKEMNLLKSLPADSGHGMHHKEKLEHTA